MHDSRQPAARHRRRLTIIDDDLLSREVVALLADEAGFQVTAYDSGEAALAGLNGCETDAILTDMQMPGVSGSALAERLRRVCGPDATLLAMSGSPVADIEKRAFDGFLMKPFSIDDLCAMIEGSVHDAAAADDQDLSCVLNPGIYESFARSLSKQQVAELYTMSLDDAERRIEGMRAAMEVSDADAYCRAAHAIKGGCGMVGALELARLASRMEENGPEFSDDKGALQEFLSASARLRRILDAKHGIVSI